MSCVAYNPHKQILEVNTDDIDRKKAYAKYGKKALGKTLSELMEENEQDRADINDVLTKLFSGAYHD